MKNYEIYLTDDSGRRITTIKNAAFLSLSRAIEGYGTLHVGLPFQDFNIFPTFLPDRRIEVWRSPMHGATMREEGTYLLRKWNVYTREEDNVQIVEFFGRSPIDVLRRQSVTSDTLANYRKTNQIDDMMKEIVDENFISPPQTAPVGELTVDGDEGLGPSITHSFFSQNVLDVLKALHDISVNLNDDIVKRIYFDVVRGVPLTNGGYGFVFRTYADLRGIDRRKGMVFSLENGNIKAPSYYEDHLDSFTVANMLNLSTPGANGYAISPESTLSRWNTIVAAQQSSETSINVNDAKAREFLQDGKADNALNVTFLNSPGSNRQPRSLYGVDWDLGDILPVRYANKDLLAEVTTVYISVNEDGKENIVGMSRPRAAIPAVHITRYGEIVFDAVSATNTFGNSAAAKTAALILGAGTNRIVIAGININNSAGFSPAPTFNGVTMTLAVTTNNGAIYSYLYYILEANLPVAGTYNLSVDPVTAGYGGLWCLALENVKQDAPEATGTGSNASDVGAHTTNITTLTNNAWCVDTQISNVRTWTADAEQTERVEFTDTNRTMVGSTKIVTVAGGTTTLGWTPDTNTSYAHVIAAFAPVEVL